MKSCCCCCTSTQREKERDFISRVHNRIICQRLFFFFFLYTFACVYFARSCVDYYFRDPNTHTIELFFSRFTVVCVLLRECGTLLRGHRCRQLYSLVFVFFFFFFKFSYKSFCYCGCYVLLLLLQVSFLFFIIIMMMMFWVRMTLTWCGWFT
jgi:hypothetical protein